MSRSKTHILCLGQPFRNIAVFEVFFGAVSSDDSLDRSIELSISQSIRFICRVSSVFIGMWLLTPSFTRTLPLLVSRWTLFWRMYDGISSQHSPIRSFATVTERTRRNFYATFSFPNLIISNLAGGQFTFRPVYSQQKQVMLPINLLKTEKHVTVLLCSAVLRFLKECALFESLHASPDVLVTAAWRWFLRVIRGMMLNGGNGSFRIETDS